MNQSSEQIRDSVLVAALVHVPFDGWTMEVLRCGAEEAGFSPDMAPAVFPGGVPEAVNYFSSWADRQMLVALETVDPESLRIRDRIRIALETRFDLLLPHREAVRMALAYWSVPPRGLRAGKAVWRTSDIMWEWAGDTATDYNRYTKRGLLTGILAPATLVWLNDDSDDMSITKAFLDRRIENVMQLGKFIGRFKKQGAGRA